MPTDNQIEDIFQAVDKAPKNVPGNLMYNNPALGTIPTNSTPPSSNKKIFIGLGLFLMVAILCGVIFIMIKQFGLFQKQEVVPDIITQIEVEEAVVVPEQEVFVAPRIETVDDYDNDGLPREEEIILQTNPNKSDTDNDGLSDYDEVKNFLTDPLASDSDGDGFLDGEEVKAGYNPRGAGKLLNFEEALQQLNTNQ